MSASSSSEEEEEDEKEVQELLPTRSKAAKPAPTPQQKGDRAAAKVKTEPTPAKTQRVRSAKAAAKLDSSQRPITSFFRLLPPAP
jgi:hypothetical protein